MTVDQLYSKLYKLPDTSGNLTVLVHNPNDDRGQENSVYSIKSVDIGPEQLGSCIFITLGPRVPV